MPSETEADAMMERIRRHNDTLRSPYGESLLLAFKAALQVNDDPSKADTPEWHRAMTELADAFDSRVRDVLSEERVVTRGTYD